MLRERPRFVPWIEGGAGFKGGTSIAVYISVIGSIEGFKEEDIKEEVRERALKVKERGE
jgi:hypothetical protein